MRGWHAVVGGGLAGKRGRLEKKRGVEAGRARRAARGALPLGGEC